MFAPGGIPPNGPFPWQQQQGGIGPTWGQESMQPPEQQQQAPQKPWDRTAFRDQWMGSGIRNVPDMQNWLKTSGWGQHVGTMGSKGDKFQMPGGEYIDAVMGAGAGGNMAGPQWTVTGGGGGPQQGIGPSWGGQGNMGMRNQMGGYGNYQMQQQTPMSRTQQGQGMGQQQAGYRRPQMQQSPYGQQRQMYGQQPMQGQRQMGQGRPGMSLGMGPSAGGMMNQGRMQPPKNPYY